MASLDFLFDCSDGLKRQKMDFLIVALQKCKKGASANILANIPTKRSRRVMQNVLNDIQMQLAE